MWGTAVAFLVVVPTFIHIKAAEAEAAALNASEIESARAKAAEVLLTPGP